MTDIRRDKTADGETIVLTGDLTITQTQKVKAELLDALRSASSVEVRMENVRQLDVAFLQLLCSAHRTAAGANKSFAVGGERGRFQALLKKAGFQRHIGCRENSGHPCLWLCDSSDSSM